jgi:hypothetical protein
MLFIFVVVCHQSLEVSKIKKKIRKLRKILVIYPLFIIDDQNFLKFSYFFFIFETSSDCGVTNL